MVYKRVSKIIFAAILAVTVFSGCGNRQEEGIDKTETETTTQKSTQDSTQDVTQEAEEETKYPSITRYMEVNTIMYTEGRVKRISRFREKWSLSWICIGLPTPSSSDSCILLSRPDISLSFLFPSSQESSSQSL